MKANAVVVLVTAEEDDVLMGVLQELAKWAGTGLVHPFLVVAAGGSVTSVDGEGMHEVALFDSLGMMSVGVIRVAAVVGPDLDTAAKVARRAWQTVEAIRELAPPGLRVVDARVWAPKRLPTEHASWRSPLGFYEPSADANLVVLPEDRRDAGSVGVPLTDPTSATFTEHVAVEFCSLLGLWATMDAAPVDALKAGVTGFGQPRLHMARSFARLGEIPPIPLGAATDHQGRLPVPDGCTEVPYALATIAEVSGRIGSAFSSLEFTPPRPVAERERMGIGEALGSLRHGIAGFLRTAPTYLMGDVADGLRDVAGQTVQSAVGRSSVIQVIWKGKPRSGRFIPTSPIDPDEVTRAAAHDLDLAGGASVDQDVWLRVGRAVLAIAGGGQIPEELGTLEIGGRRAVVTDVGAIAPRPAVDLLTTMRSEAESGAPVSLLGRLGARVANAVAANRATLENLIARTDDELQRLAGYQPPSLTVPGLVTAGLGMVFVVGLVVFSGLADAVGITTMSNDARMWAWVSVSGLFVLALALVSASAWRGYTEEVGSEGPVEGAPDRKPDALATPTESGPESGPDASEIESSEETPKQPSGAVRTADGLRIAGAVAAGLVAWALAAWLGPLVWWVADDIVGFSITVGLVGFAVAMAWALNRASVSSISATRAARLLVLVTMGYGAFGLVGLLARDDGWYASITTADRVRLLLVGGGVLLGAMLVLLLAMGWDRYREERALQETGQRISELERAIVGAVTAERAAREAFEQYLATAAAWATILWRPFGDPIGEEGREPDTRPFAVRKAESRPFVMSDLGTLAMQAQLRGAVSGAGWLQRQYEQAVTSYQRRAAVVQRSDPSGLLRPDQDPREVVALDEADREEESHRWRFLDELRKGVLDADLRAPLINLEHASVAETVLSHPESLEVVVGAEPLDVFAAAILATSVAEVPPIYFQPEALNEVDRRLRPSVWWPDAVVVPPAGVTVAGRTSVVTLRDGDLAVVSVRTDLAGPFDPGHLFVSTEVPDGRLSTPDADGPTL